MHGVIDPFYVPAATGNPDMIQRGEIYEDQPMYLPARWGIRLHNFDPTEARDPDLHITGRTEDIFINHPPLPRYRLEVGEAFVLGKAKWARPVVVLAGEAVDLLAGPGEARPSDTFLCAPIYGGDQFSEEIRSRVRAYEFSSLFYLPASKVPVFDEGFVRFDHLQSIRRSNLRRRKAAMLSSEALLALEEWLFHYLTGRLPEDSLIGMYRQETMQQL